MVDLKGATRIITEIYIGHSPISFHSVLFLKYTFAYKAENATLECIRRFDTILQRKTISH